MIKLKLTYLNDERVEIIAPTKFPDGTSQVWKLKSITTAYSSVLKAEIIWQFENEAEIITVCQVSDLLDSFKGSPKPLKILNIPFLPYGRQDKPIANNMTFGQHTFSRIINTCKFDRVLSFDVHGHTSLENLHKIPASSIIDQVFTDGGYEVYCYPDGGACARYQQEPSINGVKHRDGKTGEIEQYSLITDGVEIEGKKILIVDDICDGGATFIKLMELLKPHNPSEVGLYVSHGIFSKKLQVLIDAGINRIHTTNSLPRNEELGIKIV